MKLSYNRWTVFCVLVGLSSMLGDSDAATYVVGDNLGWTIPPNPSAYATWASQHVFRVGDVLVFNYTTGAHDVAKVTKQGHDSCSSSNPIALVTIGPSSFTLNATGSDYYICTFGQHCSFGQKLAINVTSSASPSPIPNPSPAPSTPPTPSSPGALTPSTPPTPSNPGGSTPSPSPAPSNPGAPTPTPQPPSSVSPGPAPGGTMMPPPISPGSESAPRPPPSDLIPNNNMPPPPPPNSAPLVAVGSPVVALACIVLGLFMV